MRKIIVFSGANGNLDDLKLVVSISNIVQS